MILTANVGWSILSENSTVPPVSGPFESVDEHFWHCSGSSTVFETCAEACLVSQPGYPEVAAYWLSMPHGHGRGYGMDSQDLHWFGDRIFHNCHTHCHHLRQRRHERNECIAHGSLRVLYDTPRDRRRDNQYSTFAPPCKARNSHGL